MIFGHIFLAETHKQVSSDHRTDYMLFGTKRLIVYSVILQNLPGKSGKIGMEAFFTSKLRFCVYIMVMYIGCLSFFIPIRVWHESLFECRNCSLTDRNVPCTTYCKILQNVYVRDNKV